jgi:hypothetical protein
VPGSSFNFTVYRLRYEKELNFMQINEEQQNVIMSKLRLTVLLIFSNFHLQKAFLEVRTARRVGRGIPS